MNPECRLERILTKADSQERLAHLGDRVFPGKNVPVSKTIPRITIDSEHPRQTIIGFGGAFTESACHNLAQLSPAKQAEAFRAYYHPSEGLNYSLGRTHMNSCDFSLSSYACANVPGDRNLDSFTLERESKEIIPAIQRAIAVRQEWTGNNAGIKLLVSPWSPPAWMKSNQKMTNGGSLLPEFADVWARYYVRFIQELAKVGIPVWGVSVQNEPQATQTWDSCRYTPAEEAAFVGDHLGPSLAAAGLGNLKILVCDHNRDIIHAHAMAAMINAKAAKYVTGVGIHWYHQDKFEELSRIRMDYPQLGLYFTEGCIEGGVKLGQWDRGEIYAHNMIGDFNNGLEAWLDWNLALDLQGGPNHVGNYCDAPLVVDAANDRLHYQSSYWYIGHFSRFVLPGAKALPTNWPLNCPMETTAFINPNGQVVVVAMNKGNQSEHLQLELKGQVWELELAAHSIETWLI